MNTIDNRSCLSFATTSSSSSSGPLSFHYAMTSSTDFLNSQPFETTTCRQELNTMTSSILPLRFRLLSMMTSPIRLVYYRIRSTMTSSIFPLHFHVPSMMTSSAGARLETRCRCYNTFYCDNLLLFHGHTVILCYKATLPW
jgi:hypothetical protein